MIPRSKVSSHIDENLGIGFEISSDDMKLLSELNCGHATHPKYLDESEYQKQPKKTK